VRSTVPQRYGQTDGQLTVAITRSALIDLKKDYQKIGTLIANIVVWFIFDFNFKQNYFVFLLHSFVMLIAFEVLCYSGRSAILR